LLKTISILNKHCSFFFFFKGSLAVSNIDNNQHIRMISEGSCDTNDSNDADEKLALHHRNK